MKRALAAPAVFVVLFCLLTVAGSGAPSLATTRTISASVEDADSGQALSKAQLEVQLFPTEHGERKFLSLLCVPDDHEKPLYTFKVTTDLNGSFTFVAPGGPYLTKITIPQRKPVFGCIFIDTEASVQACGLDPSTLHIQQYLFVRTTNSIPGFSGDILANSACAALVSSPCDPLRLPNLVQTKKIVLLDSNGSLMRDARLEFQEYTKGKGRFVASLMTDENGVADVSSLLEGGLLRMSVDSKNASGEFLIQFTKGGTATGRQTIKFFHWRCRANVMQGAMVQPLT